MDLPLPLPPPPPYKPPSHRQTKPSPLRQIVLSNGARNQKISTPEAPHNSTKVSTRERQDTPQNRAKLKTREQPILQHPKKTNPIVWCGAILCLLFSLLLIFFGIMTLIIYVGIKPRNPVFDTPEARLSVIYLYSPEFLNSDIIFLANFSNPNRKLEVRFDNLHIELYFSETLIASQVLQPFSLRPREVRVSPVHLLSSLVYLPPNLALELQKQEQRNQIVYKMTSPPAGVLIRHSCITKR
ncbi:uncharacterized protein LOC127254203 isoform X2 [Andrographis paniculata]|uniref:uncharacterized protein LOC127254203 isoform X2 n=1 Tax=Andrographis paniculata TaxID=175694 RepID=UPI0021E6D794|nr:uncharacterized protein LOC127254203 isoform X2 [Andrographis paniculata]